MRVPCCLGQDKLLGNKEKLNKCFVFIPIFSSLFSPLSFKSPRIQTCTCQGFTAPSAQNSNLSNTLGVFLISFVSVQTLILGIYSLFLDSYCPQDSFMQRRDMGQIFLFMSQCYVALILTCCDVLLEYEWLPLFLLFSADVHHISSTFTTDLPYDPATSHIYPRLFPHSTECNSSVHSPPILSTPQVLCRATTGDIARVPSLLFMHFSSPWWDR